MRRLHRRLQRRVEQLEGRIRNCPSGVVYSPEWFAYWTETAERQLQVEARDGSTVPMEFLDAVLADQDGPVEQEGAEQDGSGRPAQRSTPAENQKLLSSGERKAA
jgi:hypothetical protein